MGKTLVFLLDDPAYQLVQAFRAVPLDESCTPAHLCGRKDGELVIQGCRFNGGRNLMFNVFAPSGVVTQFEYDNFLDPGRGFALIHVRQWEMRADETKLTEVELGNDGLAVSVFVGEKESRYTLTVPGVFSHYLLTREDYPQGWLINCAFYPTLDSRFEYVRDEMTGNLRLQSDVIEGSLSGWEEYFPDEIPPEDGEFVLLGIRLPMRLGGIKLQERIIDKAGVSSSSLSDLRGGRRVAA